MSRHLTVSAGEQVIAPNTDFQPASKHPPLALWRRLIREPMVHFALAGAVIFFISHAIERARTQSSRLIVVDDTLKTRLAALYRIQLGIAPSDSQLAQLIDTYVHDEVLYREALALSLDQGDEIVRRRLVQKMGFLLNDAAPPVEPDDATLRNYYAAHKAEFTLPSKVTLSQIFFGGDPNSAYQHAVQAKQALQQNPRARIDGVIDSSFLAERYVDKDRSELSRIFGDSALSNELDALRIGEWSAPVRSGYGWHLVRLEHRIEPELPSFESVREKVDAAVKNQQRALINQRSFDALQARYDIHR